MPPRARRVPRTGLEVAPEASRFVGCLLRHASRIPDLDAIILFGSSVDGTFDKRSDIDLLVLLATAHDPERTHLGAVLEVVAASRRDAGIDREVNPILARAGQPELDQDFLQNAAATGIVVWARPGPRLLPPPGAGLHILLHYRTDHLTPAQKSKVQRALFGQTGRKTVKGKTYRWSTPGLVRKDQHPTPGTLFLAAHEAAPVLGKLRKLGARVQQRRFYVA